MTINFAASHEDAMTISRISDRACTARPMLDRMMLEMDITACHLNDTPLDLDLLEHAFDPHFWHDITGIVRNINRETGKLDNCFRPYHTKEPSDAAAKAD